MGVAGRVVGVAGQVGAIASLTAALATPLLGHKSRGRRRLVPIVLGGLALRNWSAAWRRGGPGRATAELLSLTSLGHLVEVTGVRTGLPFGCYRYTEVLQPQVGGVPVVVSLAWYAVGKPAAAVGSAVVSSRAGAAVVGGVALAAWDLFLDPQMTAEGYWLWPSGGRYRGIPISNFVGWSVTGTVLAAVSNRYKRQPECRELDALATYGVVGAMHTFAAAVFFEDRQVAAVGGTAMLGLTLLALIGRSR